VTAQLRAIIPTCGTLVRVEDAPLAPALIASEGEQAGWRYVEFFTANIHNRNTGRADSRAFTGFFAWLEKRELILAVDWRRK
jgi:hypothetical protein